MSLLSVRTLIQCQPANLRRLAKSMDLSTEGTVEELAERIVLADAQSPTKTQAQLEAYLETWASFTIT